MPFGSKSMYAFLILLFTVVFFATLRHEQNLGSAAAKKSIRFYEDIFLSSASNNSIAAYLRELTLQPHLAGTAASLRTALYVKAQFESHNLATHFTNYTVLLSYPVSSSLTAHFGDGSAVPVPLSERGVRENGVVMPFHAYSPSGSAYGKAAFLNHGREEDYRELAAQGVEVEGCVGIVRRGGGLSRYEVVERAAVHGVAAVLMYTDGDREEEFSEGVERGTVMGVSLGVGDPLSPGWAGLETGERLQLDDPRVREKFPKLPSIPISIDAAKTILRSLKGAEVPQEWKNDLKSSSIDIGRIGPGPTMLKFSYEGEKKMSTIHNVFAVIRGSEEPDRFVLLGNHRDAWTYGAVDPNSGTAALLELARQYALLMRMGWKPRRTIILCSWDAEEFGMIGSTEWVEQNLLNLASKSVAYINVDCAVQGPGFFASATPQLDDLLLEIAKKVKDPDTEMMTIFEKETVTNQAMNIQRLSRVDSDFAPFLQHAGIPSIDMYYGKDFPVYHTAFDSYDWMVNSGDPLFHRHVAVTGVWGLIGLHLADDAILHFNYVSYARQLLGYTHILTEKLGGSFSLHPITDAIQEFMAAATEIEEEVKKLSEDETMDDGLFILKRRMLNDRLIFAERGFLDGEGLPGKQWFKHLVYGPCTNHESNLDFFPGIVDAIAGSTGMNKIEREGVIRHEIWRVGRAIQRAAYALRGQLT
ncbi:PREDICTED: probable glutamate carboxypeptidase 2 isoform X2 [Ipomoea nil]|uniref:probable glutamate carboxypeptidase 2 isoform X2 n=1 Tax=Ipomoea nil TaxID=35883 RepID=UPI000900CFEF|nr:PREDICTED: probable glutamate carboxypeptidase 2 isoform X2 [Ipomoea nil]